MADLCTCNAQLQPHDRMENVCPPERDWIEDAYAAERDPTDVYHDLWIDLGGQG